MEDKLLCKPCDLYKSPSEFHKDSTALRGYAYYCKECANARSRKWHLENKNDPEFKKARRNSNFKTKYNISVEERDDLLLQQSGGCAICAVPLSNEGLLTHTDHCHSTGKVRGILCTNCNRGLGSFKDNIVSLQNAIKYLERNK